MDTQVLEEEISATSFRARAYYLKFYDLKFYDLSAVREAVKAFDGISARIRLLMQRLGSEPFEAMRNGSKEGCEEIGLTLRARLNKIRG